MALNGKTTEFHVSGRMALRLSLALLAVFFLSLGQAYDSIAGESSPSGMSGDVPVHSKTPLDLATLDARVDAFKADGCYLEAASLLHSALEGLHDEALRARLQTQEAQMLAWGKDYDGAITVYRTVLRDHPSMAGARKGLASVLGWQGRYDNAIVQYRKVLKENPADIEAMLGMGRVLAWNGDYKASMAMYRNVLAKDSSNREARIGLGRTLWWSGDRNGADKEIGEVLDVYPDNSEARSLREKIRGERGPTLSLDFAVSDDSDDNHLEIYRAGGYYSPIAGLKLNLIFSQFEASRFSDRSRARSLGLRVSYRPLKKTTISSRIAFLSLDTPANPTSEMTGGISATQLLPGDTRAGAGYSHYALFDTAQLIRNNIRLDEFFTYISGKVIYVDLTTGIKYADYSDGNARKDFFVDISRNFDYDEIVFTAGYRLDYRDFDKDLNNGYFDPSSFFSHTFYGRARGAFFGGRIEYDAFAGGGLQSFNSKTESTTKLSLEVKGHVTRHLTIRGGAKYARSALASASGFEYREYKAGLDFNF